MQTGSTDPRVIVARERLVGHMIEQGMPRHAAEDIAAKATYVTIAASENVLIECAGKRAVSCNPDELEAIAKAAAAQPARPAAPASPPASAPNPSPVVTPPTPPLVPTGPKAIERIQSLVRSVI